MFNTVSCFRAVSRPQNIVDIAVLLTARQSLTIPNRTRTHCTACTLRRNHMLPSQLSLTRSLCPRTKGSTLQTANFLNLRHSSTLPGCLLRTPVVHGGCSWRGSSSSASGSSKGGAMTGLIEMEPVETAKIKEFLSENDMVHTQGHTCYITTCPRLTTRRMKLADVDRLFINMTTGYFTCHACKRCGTWDQLQDNVKMIQHTRAKKMKKQSQCFSGVDMDSGEDVEKAQAFWKTTVPLDTLGADDLEDLKLAFGIEELTMDTLNKYHVHTVPGSETLVFPTFAIDGSVSGVRILTHRSADPENNIKSKVTTRTIPRVDFQGLFGWNTVRTGSTEVVLTSSEVDAMAVHQSTRATVLSLPKGISTLPQKVLPLLEPCTTIRLWLGDDVQSWAAAKQFARKLNEPRCYLIRPDGNQPAPIQALRRNLSLGGILTAARPVVHKSIITFRQLRQDVFTEISQAEQMAGVKWQRYPRLNEVLKGHRRGELTVFTGPTGSGKTTFISDYSLDLCTQGVNTLWGSFEINNVRLLKTMLSQFSRTNLAKHLSNFDVWANRFELLPMYFMTFHGEENISKVIETMSHAVYVHDITHVIVDNLQFMMGSSGMYTNDKYSKQDIIISAFRKFATQKNCHVTLVIHPRKERDTDELTLSSIFGSAKATQEADNVLIIQDRRLTSVRARKYLQIVKNRFDGDLGVISLKFDKDSLSFSPSPKMVGERKSLSGSTKKLPEESPDIEIPES